MDFSKTLAITISARPYYGKSTVRTLLFTHYLEMLPMLKTLKFYTLYPEFDDKFRLHYHGVVRFKDKYQAYRITKRINKLIGYVLLKANLNEDGWVKYITKEWNTTKKILNITYPIANDTRLGYHNTTGRADFVPKCNPPGEENTNE